MKKKIILASKSPRRIELLEKAGFDVVVMPADIEEYVEPSLAPEDVVKSLALQKATAVGKLIDEADADNGNAVNTDAIITADTDIANTDAIITATADIANADAIIAADTIVFFDGIIGKPKDRQDAEDILMRLSGNTHQVYTGVAIIYNNKCTCATVCAAGCSINCPSSCKFGARKNARYGVVFSERTDVFFKPYSIDDIRDYLDTDEPYDKAGAYAIQGYFGQFIDHIDGDYSNVMGLPVKKLIEKLNGID